jgi:uncharacterized membrane protein
MKKISILLFIVGLIVTIGLAIYFKSEVNPVDSDEMTISHSGEMISKWPIFIGIGLMFVGATFFYASLNQKKSK